MWHCNMKRLIVSILILGGEGGNKKETLVNKSEIGFSILLKKRKP